MRLFRSRLNAETLHVRGRLNAEDAEDAENS